MRTLSDKKKRKLNYWFNLREKKLKIYFIFNIILNNNWKKTYLLSKFKNLY